MPAPTDLERFCQRAYPGVVASLTVVCGSRLLAEELAQDAFERLARDWRGVRRMSSPEGWLHTVAINLAHSRFRRRAAERRALERFVSRNVYPKSEPDISEHVDTRQAIAQLPHRQQTAVLLRYFLDLTYAQIADAMEVRTSTAKSLVQKGLANLGRPSFRSLKEVPDVL